MIAQEVLEQAFRSGQKHFEWLDQLHGPLEKPSVEPIENTCGIIWDRKGKRLRCHFVHWFSQPYGIPFEELKLYIWAVEAIHTATLLHDDVIDKAETRRGGPSANQIVDNTVSILSGDYLMSDAIHQLALKGHPELMKGMCLALKNLSQGEVLQHQNQFHITDCESLYSKICDFKTSSLLEWAASVGPTLKNNSDLPIAVKFSKSYGLLYQFTDDILDIRGTVTKDHMRDLSEGKLNWAAWKILQMNPKLKAKLQTEFQNKYISESTQSFLLEAFHHPSNYKNLEHHLLQMKNECLKYISLLRTDSLRHLLKHLVDFTASRVV